VALPKKAYPGKVTALLQLPETSEEAEEAVAIGLVVPFDFALDAECWRWLPEGTTLYVTRTPSIANKAVTIALAEEVSDANEVRRAVHTLSSLNPAAVAYGCTSGSFVKGIKGERKLRNVMLRAGAPQAVTSSGALSQALKHLGVKRLAVATPYNYQLTVLLHDYLEQDGVEVVSSNYLDKENGIARISHDTVRYLARTVDRPEADAIFLSCTNLRTFDIIEELEEALGKPILSGNQVMMWAALAVADIPLPDLNQRLFRKKKPDDVEPMPMEDTTQPVT
jgi:maleate isomerase